ncbi:hypothetical protein CCGE525_25840 (plasmid) [Rhizobium jaguaris]|uniref:Uncharacterized protein n=1 Tax=Rhizobium jaguaris TaxID=1312183 RepID=A0A387G1L8_9HYPH|nr:hypothetical protein CCGE525_25840 [Rhizobium jaguaris]
MKTIGITPAGEKGKEIGAARLKGLSVISIDEYRKCPVFDAAATNRSARRSYKREGPVGATIGFVKPLRWFA